MTKSDRFAIIIVDIAIALVTSSFVGTIALLAGSAFGHPSPVLLALECGGVVAVATFGVCILTQGAHTKEG